MIPAGPGSSGAINPWSPLFRIYGYTYMERRIKYGISLLIFLATGLSIYGIFFHSTPGSKRFTKAAVHIGAIELATAFDNHEGLSDSLYLYKVLSVSGVVNKIRKNRSGSYTVTLGDRTSTAPAVSCILDSANNHRYLPLMVGDSLTIWGTCAGHLTDVLLVQCIIEKR